jgi:hypothetical protein
VHPLEDLELCCGDLDGSVASSALEIHARSMPRGLARLIGSSGERPHIGRSGSWGRHGIAPATRSRGDPAGSPATTIVPGRRAAPWIPAPPAAIPAALTHRHRNDSTLARAAYEQNAVPRRPRQVPLTAKLHVDHC